jgi:hypothetical protein
MLAVIGACSSLASVAVGSARQALTPDRLLGRLVTAYRLVSFSASGLGALAGGVVADRYTIDGPLLAAAGFLAVAGLGMLMVRHRKSQTDLDG